MLAKYKNLKMLDKVLPPFDSLQNHHAAEHKKKNPTAYCAELHRSKLCHTLSWVLTAVSLPDPRQIHLLFKVVPHTGLSPSACFKDLLLKGPAVQKKNPWSAPPLNVVLDICRQRIHHASEDEIN
ncbi:hypothetical protein ILYODFUR_013621 [Ilyodon furcidens]|uniref:Uncharacterized protein n=1 Tax=Ilyodon furcidens TaxID=33524 RepID=A0ABV0SWT0_9TELE